MKNNCYCEPQKPCCNDEACINNCDYTSVLERAFYDENGKKYPHQHRIPKDVLNAYKIKLSPLESEFKACESFDDVYKLFKEHQTFGIGNLTIYDVAFKVSRNYGIYPDKVYLHAGTKKGALNAGLIKKFNSKKYLTMEEITGILPWLENAEPCQIEDFLCIYKDDISKNSLDKYLNSKQNNLKKSCTP